MARLGIDVGGTFVDIVLTDQDGGRVSEKMLAESADLVGAIVRGVESVLALAEAPPSSVDTVVLATTRGSNTVLERTGPRTGLVTTRGFRDVLQIQRALRWSMYDVQLDKPAPLVPRSLTWVVTERILADGSVHIPLDEEEVRAVGRALASAEIEAVAIAFMHAYANPQHERRTRELLLEERPELVVSLSSDVSLQAREYERANTAVVNAYIAHAVADHLREVHHRFPEIGLDAPVFIMQSSGGLASVDQATSLPVRTLESGPAAGVLASAGIATAAGFDDAISFDMGGTTAKAAVISGGVPATTHYFELERTENRRGSGLPVDIPALDLVEVGAGGGSIAEARHGVLQVGPRSAGATPGPACYARGGILPTVTDANLLLGYYDADRFAGGKLTLDVDAAARSVGRLAAELGVDQERAAWGIHEVANLEMERAIRLVSINRGFDPREFAFVCLGGAGPTHGVRLARSLGCRRALVPPSAGVGSAAGLLGAQESVEFAKSALIRLDEPDASDRCAEVAGSLEQEARQTGWKDRHVAGVRWSVGMRYAGQGHELVTSVDGSPGDALSLVEAFHDRYAQAYGYREDTLPVEAVTWYVSFVGDEAERGRTSAWRAETGGVSTRRAAFFPETGVIEVDVHWRPELPAGARIEGPCLVAEPTTTIVLLPGDVGEVRGDQTLLIRIGGHE